MVVLLREKLCEPDASPQRMSPASDVGGDDVGVVRSGEPNDEGAASLVHVVEILGPGITTIRKKELSAEFLWLRQELTLGLLVRGQRHGEHVVVEATVCGVELDCRRISRREAARKGFPQVILQCEG